MVSNDDDSSKIASRFPIDLGDGFGQRQLVSGDAPALARYADNRKIWLEVRDRMPHPYRLEDAQAYIERNGDADPPTHFALTHQGEAIGSIGLMLGTDIERISAEIGYWIGEPFWGRGVVQRAVEATVAYGMPTFGLRRIFAQANVRNIGSNRVLEKAGFALDATLRSAAIKDGEVLDQNLWSFVR